MLHVGHLNIYHLASKLPDFCNYLNQASPSFQLYGITESRLSSNIPNDILLINNYDIIRRDAQHPKETGIVAFIHQSITQLTQRRPELEHSHVECMWLEVKSNERSPSTYVCFIYRNPASHADWYDYFTEMLDNVYKSKPHSHILILGDFNIDMLKNQPQWETLLISVGLTQLISNPTRVTQTSETLIDHIYTNTPSLVSFTSVSQLSVSDHFPITCMVNAKVTKSHKHMHTTISYRSFKNFNKAAFLHDLGLLPFDDVFNYSDPNQALDLWYKYFFSVLDLHAPVRQRRVKHPQLPQWLTSEIVRAMSSREQLKKLKMFEEYKKARNIVKNMIRDSKRSYFSKLVENNNKDTSQLWRALNTLIKGNGSRSRNIPPSLTASMFNEHFTSAASSLLSDQNVSHSTYKHVDKIKTFCSKNNSSAAPFNIPPIAVHEVGKHISLLNNKKSTGPDEISSYILKLSLPYIVEPITYIYNLCIAQNIFPSSFKKAKVIPLPKSNLVSDLNNYRPISLLPVLSKILEKHVHGHFISFLEMHKLLHPFQSGFRHNHSCTTALTLLTNKWLSAINDFQMSGVVFLDFSKAFDLVNHNILLEKLKIYLNNSDTVHFFGSFLEKRSQKVHVHGAYSSKKVVKCGVPQGSVLGPILFSMYVNDLPLTFSNSSVECHMLADDTTIHTQNSSIYTIQHTLVDTLREISSWCTENLMVLNPSKSKSMLMTTRQKHQLSPLTLNLSIDNKSIDQVDSHKLLGVVLDHQLCWKPHIDSLCKKLSKNLYLFSRLQQLITQEARLLFFHAHIKSHFDYASIIWDGASDVLLKKLKSIHKRSVKLIKYDVSISSKSNTPPLNVLPLETQLTYNKAILLYKVINGHAPKYLVELFHHSPSRYSAHKCNLALPKPRLDICKTSFSYSGALLWNSIPPDIKNQRTFTSFKKCLFKYLLNSKKT